GSDLDKASQAQLARGKRMVELLKQGQYKPIKVEHQIISIYAGANGHLDDIPVVDILRCETELIEFFTTRKADLVKKIADEGKLSDDVVTGLNEGIKEFKQGFKATA
ncbi:MAG: F0F1 ATP synthase subunit alpha, partial [Elusimicrobia bacterium]